MDLLEVPLDSLVLHFYSLQTAAGSLWTWVAVLTAAVGIWGIRAVGFKSDSSSTCTSSSAAAAAAASSSSTTTLTEETVPSDRKNSEKPIVVRSPSCSNAEEVSTPKARFTAYYSSAISTESENFDDEADVEEVEEATLIGDEDDGVCDDDLRVTAARSVGRRMDVDSLALRRRADLGWYRYQDLTALNGSVVRLWDGR